MRPFFKARGFTLIEVLLALSIIAISLTALLKATSQDVAYTQKIKEKTLGHWVASQGISQVQLGLLNPPPHREITQSTLLFNQKWYWRVKVEDSELPSVQVITVRISQKPSGPFTSPLIGYRYKR